MFKILKHFSKKDIASALLAVLLIACQVGLELKMPDYMSEITKLVQAEGSEMSDILLNGGMMLLCALGALIASCTVGYFISKLATRLSMNLRLELFHKVEDMDMEDVTEFSTSSLITRTTNDVMQIQMFVSMGAQMLVRAPMTAIWAIVKIANKNWQWSTATAVAVVILLTTISIVVSLVLPRFKIVQKMLDRLNGVTRENLLGIRVVRAFNAEKYQENKFGKVNDELTNLRLFNQRVLSVMSPVINFIMHGLSLLIYLIEENINTNSVMAEKITLFSDMVVFSSYAMHVIMSFLFLSMVFMMLPRAQVSAERINEVLDETSTILDGARECGLEGEVGTVEFRNVSFKYPDAEEYLLEDISFKAERGQTVAFIGSTGSGKSTLINLVPRFYDVTDGKVLVDGVDVRDYKLSALNNKLGYVPQRAVMFSGTVKSNVCFGENGKEKISNKKMRAAIKTAQGKDFVEKMDKEYDSHIAQGGTNVSGGQKQRLAIARAVARDPEIFIFDDSFSALDYKTDTALRHALKTHTKDATTLIVAQRIGTIMHADQILVLDKGKCVGKGTHKELMKNCKVYQQIALSQLTKEELDV